mmetsp:Transcript_18566/g.40413  ORF Transcript_18566/g.40413 Transcript_18566/m.40413 type:complete len:356 (+) Transcript_18566:62-1129(+)
MSIVKKIMIFSSRILIASTLVVLSSLGRVSAADSGTPVIDVECSHIATSVGDTDDCCQCACGSDQCAVFKKFGESLVCDPLKVHCYLPDDTETFDDAEGEWVETIKEDEDKDVAFAECSDVAIPSMAQTEDCCMCACGNPDCAIFKSVGAELSCDARHIHCYEDDEEDEDDSTLTQCTDIAIPSASETQDCCMCACGNGNCAVFQSPGEELVCNPEKIHCYEDDEEDDSRDGAGGATALGDAAATADGGTVPVLADCSNVEVDFADTAGCCSCACGHTDCAIYHGPDEEDLQCDVLKIHCYEGDDDDSGDFLEDWVADYAEKEMVELAESSTAHLFKNVMIVNAILGVGAAMFMI